MNPANYREALIETRLDEAEGADILMVHFVSWLILSKFLKALSRSSVLSSTGKCEVIILAYSLCIAMFLTQVKPAMPYLDVIRLLRDNTSLPISAYQVHIFLRQTAYKCSQLSQ